MSLKEASERLRRRVLIEDGDDTMVSVVDLKEVLDFVDSLSQWSRQHEEAIRKEQAQQTEED